ncbi:MAG: outer membrane beta-barrel protein [Saprospiraceae bacterium]|nr:outer membrane beta-barrel protein [Saprospiraceae bacterium]
MNKAVQINALSPLPAVFSISLTRLTTKMVQALLRYSIVIGLLLSSLPGYSQYFEGGIAVGGSVYEGDLTPKAFGDKIALIKPAVGLFVRQNFNEHWAARLSFNYGKIEAADGPQRSDRNLSFSSNFGELAALVEYNYPGFDPAGYRKLSPYVYAGLAYMHYNPTTVFQGRTIFLQPLGTEGQGLDGYDQQLYSLNILTIPFGGGIKYALNSSFTIAAEFGPRLTFTDYLDDVSGNYASYRDLAQNRGTLAANVADRNFEITGTEPIDRGGAARGNPKFNDWYFVGQITISYHFYDLFSNHGGCPMTF